ncbi:MULTISPECIES: ArnT family glycosyltransferase [Gammaproteobacteria]|uniref:ArnT family glycosyltransferase n=2 Tax=Gammaproteobacteria TaxID=1236 RepID=UPI00336AE726
MLTNNPNPNPNPISVSSKQYWLLTFITALVFIAVNVSFRPILPIDETRYISVAWEMWLDKNWLVPHINGSPYDHKPPFMFWLFNIVWSVFGTSETVSRLVVPVFSLLNLFLVNLLARKVYPDSKQAQVLSPLILFSFLGWFLYSGMIMFDLILTVFYLLAILSLWKYSESNRPVWIWFTGTAIGFALLTKGPVIFVHFLPFVMLVRIWHPSPSNINKAFFKAVLWAVLISVAIILMWAIPAAISGGEEYARAIFWGQSVDRMQNSFAHARPFYWYVLLLPALLFPWLFLSGFWRSRPWVVTERGDTLCLALFAIILVIFSCFSGKQIHYLFPTFPFVAVWIAKQVDLRKFKTEFAVVGILILIVVLIFGSQFWVSKAFRSAEITDLYQSWGILPLLLIGLLLWKKTLPIDRLALNIGALLLSLSALLASLSPVLKNVYDVTEPGQRIHQLQSEGNQVSFIGKYHNTFGYAGKLEIPLHLVPSNQAERDAFLRTEPGYTVWIQRHESKALEENAIYTTPFRGQRLYVIENKELEKVLQASK